MKFHFSIIVYTALFFAAALGFSMSASAQQVTPQVMAHAKNIASVCPGSWEKQDCLAAMSESNITLAANYAQALDNAGKPKHLEPLKQKCAASTAATKGKYPAEAMVSAFTECANGIFEIYQNSDIEPDQSHYQLLISAIWCLKKDPQCKLVEQSLVRNATK